MIALRVAPLAALLLALPSTGLAWGSKCRAYEDPHRDVEDLEPSDEACEAGPLAARGRMVLTHEDELEDGRQDEHGEALRYGMEIAGLPPELLDTWVLQVFAGDAEVPTGWISDVDSIAPVPFEEALTDPKRSFTIYEMAQLPDFSFALWDWAGGNETCPLPGADAEAYECHRFTSHMGAVNSNHFPPQAGSFYARLHGIALERAGQCQLLHDWLSADPEALWRFADTVQECEVEALTIEAVGQHYLQDIWSSGHMWERWGSPDLDDFPGADYEERNETANTVGAVAGMIHGVGPLFGPMTDYVPLYDMYDPLCDPGDWTVQYLDAEGTPRDCVGDRNLLGVYQGDQAEQAATMFACVEAGIAEVYDAGPRSFGERAPAPAPFFDDVAVASSTSDECLEHRVTNQSFFTGWGVGASEDPFGKEALADTLLVTLLEVLTPDLSSVYTDTELRGFLDELGTMRLHAFNRAQDDPLGTDLANLDEEPMTTLLGVERNRAYDHAPQLATYQDPPLPWPATSDATAEEAERADLLARTFHKAHAEELCDATSADTLTAAVDHVPEDGDQRHAACRACAELISRHLRVGWDETAYDDRAEPRCEVLGGAPPPLVYQPIQGDVTDPVDLAWDHCGCADEALVLMDGALTKITTDGGEIDEVGFDPGWFGGDRMDTVPMPRAVAASRHHDLAVVTNKSEQSLSVYDLTPGEEHEIDVDDDPETTDPDAPDGVTRIGLAGEPQGVDVVSVAGRPWALVTVDDSLAVIDLDELELCKTIPFTDPGPWDVSVLPSGTKAYVSFRNTLGTPGDAVAVLDMMEALDCDGAGGEVLDTISDFGTDAGMGAMALSPDAAWLAVAGRRPSSSNPSYDFIAIIDTRTDTVLDVASAGSTRFFRSALYPYAVSWFPDGDSLGYATFSGVSNTIFDFLGTVRVGDWLYGVAESGEESYDVGLSAMMLGKSLLIDGDWIYVGDVSGGVTAVPRSLFSGYAGIPWSENVGGCGVVDGGYEVEVCPQTDSLGVKIRAMSWY